MKQQSKLSQEQQQDAAHTVNQSQQQAGREFANADELLRFDAEQTVVPPEIAARLRESAADAPAPKPAWWKKLLGR